MSLRSRVRALVPERFSGSFGPAFGAAMDRLGVPPGSLLAGRDVPRAATSGLPVVLVLHLGEAEPQALAVTVDRLRRLAVPVARVRPVLVVDGPHLQVARRAGVPVDHLLPESALAARHPGLPYATYLAGRLAGLTRDYATAHVVTVGRDGWAGTDDDVVVALLTPPARPRRRVLRDRALSRLERLVDPA